jgi:hypothetical protein
VSENLSIPSLDERCPKPEPAFAKSSRAGTARLGRYSGGDPRCQQHPGPVVLKREAPRKLERSWPRALDIHQIADLPETGAHICQIQQSRNVVVRMIKKVASSGEFVGVLAEFNGFARRGTGTASGRWNQTSAGALLKPCQRTRGHLLHQLLQ